MRLHDHIPHEMRGSDIVLVSGLIDMNRCLDGDVVAVECVRNEAGELIWQHVDDLREESGREEEKDAFSLSKDEGSDRGASLPDLAPGMLNFKIPRGKVVAIVRQNEQASSVVAHFPASIDSTTGVRGSATVLVKPDVATLPLIRVRTRLSLEYADCYVLVRIHSWPSGSCTLRATF